MVLWSYGAVGIDRGGGGGGRRMIKKEHNGGRI